MPPKKFQKFIPEAWDADDDWIPNQTSSSSSSQPYNNTYNYNSYSPSRSPAPSSSSSPAPSLYNPSAPSARPTLLSRNSSGPNYSSAGYAQTSDFAVPVVVSSGSAQPRTLYQPELKILKRDTTAAGPAPRVGVSSTKEQREQERKEKERKYKEARDKIFNAPAPSPKPASKPLSHRSLERVEQREPQNKPEKPKKSDLPAPKPRVEGLVKGFSLNNAALDTKPIIKRREREEWQLRQVEIDGKMSESQAMRYGFNGEAMSGGEGDLVGFGEEAGGVGDMGQGQEQGLEWDEFRRDRWGGAGREERERGGEMEGLTERVGRVGLADGGRGDRRGDTERNGEEAVKAVRQPRGPMSGGARGFAGRGGRGRGG